MLETSWAVTQSVEKHNYNENYYSKPHKTPSTISNELPLFVLDKTCSYNWYSSRLIFPRINGPIVFRFAAKLTIQGKQTQLYFPQFGGSYPGLTFDKFRDTATLNDMQLTCYKNLVFQEFFCGGSLLWFKLKTFVKHILKFWAAGRRGWGLFCRPNLQRETKDDQFIYHANQKEQLFTKR